MAALALALLLLAAGARAHDIPTDVRVQLFVKPEGARLLVLARVPLAAMNEVDLPLTGPGYLDLARADAALQVAAKLWFADNLAVLADGVPLPYPGIAAARVSLASDRSFGAWDTALAHLRGPPIPPGTQLYWKQQHFDLLLEYPIASPAAAFTIDPRLARLALRVATTLRFLPPGGEERAFEFHGNPGPIDLDPSWHQAALRFVAEGFRHILDGTDHLLFIACLAIPIRRLRALVVIATAFTIAHSLTLAATAFGFAPSGLWFPPLVETLIAATIVLMALENMIGGPAHRRWLAAFAFGLVHGFGFAFALRESLQFAGGHLLTARRLQRGRGTRADRRAARARAGARRHQLRFVPERAGILVLSALVAHTGWHWMTERWANAKFPLPALDAAALASLARWLMALVVLALLAWAADGRVRLDGRGEARGRPGPGD